MFLDRFLVHTVTVEPLQGVNGQGQPVYGAALTVQCFTDDKRHLVRNKTGEEVTSSTTLYVRTKDAGSFIEGSRVTLPTLVDTAAGDPLPPRVSRVIKISVFDSGPLGLPDHAEVSVE